MSACEINGVTASHVSTVNMCTRIIHEKQRECLHTGHVYTIGDTVTRPNGKPGTIEEHRDSGHIRGADVSIGFQHFRRWYPLEQLKPQEEAAHE